MQNLACAVRGMLYHYERSPHSIGRNFAAVDKQFNIFDYLWEFPIIAHRHYPSLYPVDAGVV